MHATTAPASATRPWTEPLINRAFALVWAGQAISNLGDLVFDTTIALWIVTTVAAGQAWAPLAVSGALVAAAVPDLLVGPFAGVLVDRKNKRSIMLRMDLIRAAIILSLALLTGAIRVPGQPSPIHSTAWLLGSLYLAVFASATCAQFFGPARMAIIGEIVPEPHRARASGLAQVTGSLATIIGPLIAVPVYFSLGPGSALVANALSFVVSFTAISLTGNVGASSGTQMTAPSFKREFMDGLRFLAGNRVLKTVLVSAILVMLGGGCINALEIFFLRQNLHASYHLFGLFSAVAGVGLLLGAVVATLFADRIGVGRAFWMSLVVLGMLALVYARLGSVAPALAVIFLIGIPSAAVNVVIGPIMLSATPPELVGRVSAVLQSAITLAALLATATAGLLAGTVLHDVNTSLLGVRWGPIDLIFTWTGLMILAGGLYARSGLRRPPCPPSSAMQAR